MPLLPPTLAAVVGTFGELFFPMLLVLGLFTRVGALGLFAVNALAVISYWHVLGGEGYRSRARAARALGLHARRDRGVRRRRALARREVRPPVAPARTRRSLDLTAADFCRSRSCSLTA